MFFPFWMRLVLLFFLNNLHNCLFKWTWPVVAAGYFRSALSAQTRTRRWCSLFLRRPWSILAAIWWNGDLVKLLRRCSFVRVCASVLWSAFHMVVQLCADVITKALPDVLASCLWHSLCLFLCVCVCVCGGGVSGGMRQHFVGAGSDLTPPLTRAFLKAASGCLLCPCAHVLMCPGIRLAYNIVFIQHFPFHRHFSPLGKRLCVFVMETKNVVAVLIWSCSLVLSECVRYRMNQSAVTSEVWAGGMDYLASYWNTHFRGEWERERGMMEHACICILRCPTFQQHRDIGTVM